MKVKAWSTLLWLSVAILAASTVSACGGATQDGLQKDAGTVTDLEPASLGDGEKLRVVATTNIVADVVRNVGGDRIELTTLMGVGIDPHSYVPSPSDTAATHDAHVVFASGAGLEATLDQLLANAGGHAVQISLSQGLAVHASANGDAHAEHDEEAADPHVWFDVQNVTRWVDTVETTLSALDPDNAEIYQENARVYSRDLEDLDAWVEEQVAKIPESNRKLVTNHPVFGYFAERYGLEQVGAVYPISPSAEPSAQDIAALVDAIREYGVPAVFAESTVNPKLTEQVAADTGVALVPLYTGSLGEPGSGAETYILMIRYDVEAIVEALK